MKRNTIRNFADNVMGRQVRYSSYYQRVGRRGPQGETRYHWEPRSLPGPCVGWAVGVRWLQQGVRRGPFWEEQACLVETGPRTPCVLVTRWPTRKPDKVPFDDIELVEIELKLFSWPDSERALVSNQSQEWPRDERGRFKAEPNLISGPKHS